MPFPKSNDHLPPRHNQLPIIQKLVATYKLWHETVPHFPKTSRYTLGARIDSLFLDAIEHVLTAIYAPAPTKIVELGRSITTLDTLKFFLQVSWEVRSLDNKKYLALSEQLDEIGRMLGGWRKGLEKTPAR